MASKFESTEAQNLVNGFCKALAGGKTKEEFKATITESGADVSGNDEWDKIVDLADMMAAGVIEYLDSLEKSAWITDASGESDTIKMLRADSDDTSDAGTVDLTV